MGSDVVVASMTKDEARELVTEIKAGISAVGEKLLELYERKGWKALGYLSWRECVMVEFDFEKSRVYELLNFAKVTRNLSAIAEKCPLPANEAQARPISKLTPQLQCTVWPIVVETAPNGHITANHVQRVVDRYLDTALADESHSICPQCGQVCDGDSCPDCSLFESENVTLTPTLSQGERENNPFNPSTDSGYNYKRDNRRSVAADIYTPQGMDACQTPAYALDPLLPYLPREWVIWEPACGEGLLEDALYDSGFGTVVSGDILTGQNFFDYEPERWDCLITNPPYSIQEQWLERCYQLDKPFALLLKVEVLGNKGIQALVRRYGFEMMLLDQRVDFKMPYKGWDSSAQFPTFWLCRLVLSSKVVFGSIEESKRQFKQGHRD